MYWARTESLTAEEQRKLHGSPERLAFCVAAVFGAGLLAIVAGWFLDARFPIPDDRAIEVGVWIFLFVMFLDFFLIVPLAGSKFRQGQPMAAARRTAGLLLLGLLVASVAGSLPWLWGRLVATFPWMDRVALPLLLLGSVARSFWTRRQRGKASPAEQRT